MPSSLSGLVLPALPALAVAVVIGVHLVRRAAKIRALGPVQPGRKVVVLNLLDRNR